MSSNVNNINTINNNNDNDNDNDNDIQPKEYPRRKIVQQPDEDDELYASIKFKKLDLIRLITPTTNPTRLSKILKYASGFLYYVAVAGITGQKSANINELKKSLKIVKSKTNLPIVIGFGIKNVKQAKEICQIADGAVIGSAIIKIIEKNLNNSKKILIQISSFIKKLKKGIEQ